MNQHERDTSPVYGTGAGNGGKKPGHRGPGPEVMGAATLVGNTVCNCEGEDLGEIKEIMLDMRRGTIAYAVLSFGGFIGLGSKLFAVPWSALTLDTENRRFVLDVRKERLAHAPGFDTGAWPDMADDMWSRNIHSYYGTAPDTSFGRW